jgi:hypothetical protein
LSRRDRLIVARHEVPLVQRAVPQRGWRTQPRVSTLGNPFGFGATLSGYVSILSVSTIWASKEKGLAV